MKNPRICENSEVVEDNNSGKGICQTSVYSQDKTSIVSGGTKKYILSNGIGIIYLSGNTALLSPRRGRFVIDLSHGSKMIMGENAFSLNLIVLDNVSSITSTKDYSAATVNFCGNQISREHKLSYCNDSISDTHGYTKGIFCTALIECNNWKIPKDYPIKFD